MALGHIHQQQTLNQGDGESFISYSGSAYPVDWGERDVKRLSLVEIAANGSKATMEKVPYGHPARVKHEWDVPWEVPDIDDFTSADGDDVWAVIKAPADWPETEASKAVAFLSDQDQMAGAHSVRVTIEREPRERVRVKDMTAATSWADQVKQWADATSTPLKGADIHEMVDTLEAAARKDGAIPQPRRWRIKSLRLRGAIGVWKGRGIDDLGIDFDDFEAGLIALTGPNGAGQNDRAGEPHSVAGHADALRAAAAALPPTRFVPRTDHRRRCIEGTGSTGA